MTTRIAVCLILTALLAGCGAFGNIDTAAMQTTNQLVGAPPNGPGNPPSPRPLPPLGY